MPIACAASTSFTTSSPTIAARLTGTPSSSSAAWK